MWRNALALSSCHSSERDRKIAVIMQQSYDVNKP